MTARTGTRLRAPAALADADRTFMARAAEITKGIDVEGDAAADLLHWTANLLKDASPKMAGDVK